MLYKKLLEEFAGDYKATGEYTDENIYYALTIHEGHSIPGFPSLNAFIYLLRPHLEKLKEPIEECFSNVFEYLEFLSKKILEKVFTKFPHFINDINDLVSSYLIEQRDKTKYLLDSIVDMEINYFFTNDYEYLNNFNIFISKSQTQINNVNMSNSIQGSNDSKQRINEIKPQMQMSNKNIFIKEIRNRIDAYFKLIVRNLRESIPKIIGKFLVNEIKDNIQIKLYNKLYNLKQLTDSLIETENTSERKKELNEMIKILKNVLKEIRGDPYFKGDIDINDSYFS